MKINRLNIAVETYGSNVHETIVFLNGVMASYHSWKYYIENLKDTYHIVCHDFKGQLKSDKPRGPYTFLEHAKETVEILKTLGIKKAHFIGTSYGGEVGLKIAIEFPEYVETLVVINSASELNQELKDSMREWIKLCERADGELFFWGIAKQIYSPSFIDTHKTFLEARAQATKAVDKSYFKGQIALYETFLNDLNLTKDLYKISAPTFVISSDQDVLKPSTFSKVMAEHIQGSRHEVIKGSGHVSIFEKQEDVFKLIKAWLINR